MANTDPGTAEHILDSHDLTDIHALVTGASSGIGMELARALAANGANLVMLCRNQDKAKSVVETFRRLHGDAAAERCLILQCDLSSMRSVKNAVERLENSHIVFDRCFLNAGIFGVPYQLTEEGNELTYAANYLGHYYLLHRCIAADKIARNGRVICTISEGAYMNPFSKADCDMITYPERILGNNLAKLQSRSQASPNSKVFLLLMMTALRDLLRGSVYEELKFCGGDPGATLTDNINQVGPLIKSLSPLFKNFMKPVEEGASVLAHLATADAKDWDEVTLMNHRLKTIPMPRSVNLKKAQHAWEITENVLGLPRLAISG